MPLLKPIRGTLLNTSHPLARGLVGCWLMNEGTGDKICDLSGNKNNGTAQGNPFWGQGKFGSALGFDGDDYVGLGQPANLNFTPNVDEFTISFWMKVDSGNNGTIISKAYSSSAYRQYQIYVESNYIKGYSGGVIVGTTIVVADGKWHWVVLRNYNDSGTLKCMFYVDGIEVGGVSASGSVTNDMDVLVGARRNTNNTNVAFLLTGTVEMGLIFARALSASEIAQFYREPFCMFERAIRPELIGGPIVNLVGTLTDLSSLSATAKAIRKVDGTVASTSNVAALLNSIRGEGSSLEIEKSWLREALFNGMTANAFKLGTTLSLGWFWVRVAGCSVLYRGLSMERMDFTNILTVAEQNACEISPPSYIPHNNSSTYFYVIRRFSNCGYQELTLAAATKVSIDANGELEKPQPSNIFSSKAEQVDGNKIQLVWFYCPLEQKSQPVCFNIYYDGGMGQIDYENPLAKICYEGRRFYSYQSSALGAGGYLFTIRAEDAGGVENSSSVQLKIQLDTTNPDAIDILSTETF